MLIGKPETAQQKAFAFDWWLFTQQWMSNNASESDYESPGCDCSDGLIPDRGGRYTRMRSWEAGAHPDREIAHWFCQWNLNSKVFLKFNIRQVQWHQCWQSLAMSTRWYTLIIFAHHSPRGPDSGRTENHATGQILTALNLWSVRKRWDYMNSWRGYW